MKRFFIFFASLMMTIFTMPKSISSNVALLKAQKFLPGKEFVEGKILPSARAKGPKKHDAFYVFNAKDGDGFVIVSGDDRTKEILGYSMHGNFDSEKLPENLKWWLEGYARQIEALDSSLKPAVHHTDKMVLPAIPPLIKSKWNQGAPYFYMCPDGNYVDYYEPGYNTNNRCVTGCVATAMAQIMYYWKWPQACPAIDGYQINNMYTIKALPATTFQWNDMKDTYGWETGASADAVAKLMRYCGQAVHMQYTPSGSSAGVSTTALASIFQYSPNTLPLLRDNNDTSSRWETLIYDELAAMRPVLYDGDPDNGEGHAFIVDGYDGNGLFHINWGWGGRYDSYFVLSVVDHEQGISYRYNQGAILGLKPAEQDEVMLPWMFGFIDKLTPTATYNRTSTNTDFANVLLRGDISTFLSVKSDARFDMEIGWGLIQNNALLQKLDSKTETISWWTNGISYNASLSFGAGLPDGKYQLSFIYRFVGDTEWKLCVDWSDNQLWAEVNGNSMRVSVPTPSNMSFKVNSITTHEPTKNEEVGVTTNITNTGETKKLKVGLWIQKDKSQWKNTMVKEIILDRECSSDITLSFVPEEAGIYQVKITAGGSDESLSSSTIKVADTEMVKTNGINYECVPDYRRAKVIRQEDGMNFSQQNVTIPSTVACNGVDCKVTAIDDYAFYFCRQIKTLIIPEGVKTIGSFAFSYCSQIETLVIPEGVETVRRFAFAYMENLTRIELPSTLKEIGDGMIRHDNELKIVVSHIMEPFGVDEYTFILEFDRGCPVTLYVPIGTKDKYERLSGWKSFANIEENQEVGNEIIPIEYNSYSSSWYDLQGIRVGKPQKGIYINNGKKYIQK